MLVGRQPNLIFVFCIYFLPLLLLLNLFLLLYLMFAFMFAVFFSISSLGAKEERTSKKEIQPQNNSTNEEKNATNANSR